MEKTRWRMYIKFQSNINMQQSPLADRREFLPLAWQTFAIGLAKYCH